MFISKLLPPAIKTQTKTGQVRPAQVGLFIALTAAVIAAGVALFAPYFQTGVPHTHDGLNHLARFANYKIALREGQFPPRFAPNLMNHYGYPVFNYNYPLANLLSLPFSVADINYQLTFKILMMASVVLGASGLCLWLKLCLDQSEQIEYKPSSDPVFRADYLFAIALFLTSPFLTNLVYVRGNIGEMMAMNLFIWLLVSIELVRSRFSTAQLTASTLKAQWSLLLLMIATTTAFLLSHNVSVLFGLPVVILYGLLRGINLTQWFLLGKIFLISLALSLWFWLPALAEKHLIVLDAIDLTQEFALHFPRLEQVLFAPLNYGFSRPSPVDSLSFAMGKPQLGLVILVVAAAVAWLSTDLRFGARAEKSRSDWHPSSLLIILLSLSLLLLVFQLPITKPVWQILPLVQYIQFPWRLMMFAAVLIAMLGGVFLQQLIAKHIFITSIDTIGAGLKFILLTLLIMQILSMIRLKPADMVQRRPIDYDVYSESTSTLNENRAKTFIYQDIADWQPRPLIISAAKLNSWVSRVESELENGVGPNGIKQTELQKAKAEKIKEFAPGETKVGALAVSLWQGSRRRYQLKLQEAAVIIEPTMNFAGWQTWVESEGRKRRVEYIDNQYIQGRLAYRLPAGKYKITSRFTQRTWPRLVGNSISLLTLLGLAISTLKIARGKRD